MLMLVAQLNYSWFRWKGVLSCVYFALLLVMGLALSPAYLMPAASATRADESAHATQSKRPSAMPGLLSRRLGGRVYSTVTLVR